MTTPLAKYLDKLCSDNPDGAMVFVQFKTSPQVVQGALRRSKDVDGLFELMARGQTNDPNNSKVVKDVMVSNYFDADAVERVIIFHDVPQPQIITPRQGGIVIPT
jgi:hypothetical protein